MGTNRQKPNHVLTVLEYRIDLIKSQSNTLIKQYIALLLFRLN
jgi:hypothetical protein